MNYKNIVTPGMYLGNRAAFGWPTVAFPAAKPEKRSGETQETAGQG